jgi:hypothetical protein
MGELTRRTATLALLIGAASCKHADDALVLIRVLDDRVHAFEAGLVRFAQTRRLHVRQRTSGQHNFEGRGIFLIVQPVQLPAQSTDSQFEFAAHIKRGLFSLMPTQEMRTVIEAFLVAMNSIDGVTASRT